MPPDTEPRTAAPTEAAEREASIVQAIDLDLLCELVYQRWLDELRRERERGGWN